MDTGNYFKPPGPTAHGINPLMLASLREMPIRVFNLAPKDLHLWPELSRADVRPCEIISSNLTPRDATWPTPQRYAIVEVESVPLETGRKLRIGFLGVSTPGDVRPNSHFESTDPGEAVQRYKKELQGKVEAIVVLADLSETAANQLAQENPEIGVIFRAEKRYVRLEPRVVNQAVVLSSVERARYLGQLLLRFDKTGKLVEAQPALIELGTSVAEHPDFLRRQKEVASGLP